MKIGKRTNKIYFEAFDIVIILAVWTVFMWLVFPALIK